MRTWKPLPKKRLAEIIEDFDSPDADACLFHPDVYALAKELQQTREQAAKVDHRIGRLMTPVGKFHTKRGQKGTCLAALPAETNGICNPSGVLVILVNGIVTTDAADNWQLV